MSNGLHIFWILSRGAGIAAIVLAGLSVSAGLLAGRNMPFARLRKTLELRPVHEALSMATIILIAAHGLLLIGDPWLDPGVVGISVPFVMDYQPFWTGVGIIAGYGMILLGLSYYVRKWIGPNRWRVAHRFIALVLAAGPGPHLRRRHRHRRSVALAARGPVLPARPGPSGLPDGRHPQARRGWRGPSSGTALAAAQD